MGTSYPFADFLSVIEGLPIADRNVKVLRPCESARGRAAPCRPAAVRFGLRACHSAASRPALTAGSLGVLRRVVSRTCRGLISLAGAPAAQFCLCHAS